MAALSIENRTSLRRRALQRAEVVLSASAVATCIVRDVSEAGARLEFGAASFLPGDFELRFAGPGKRIGVQIAWQRGLSAGVRFSSPLPGELREQILCTPANPGPPRTISDKAGASLILSRKRWPTSL